LAEVFETQQAGATKGKAWAVILREAKEDGFTETAYWRIAPSDRIQPDMKEPPTGKVSDPPFSAPNGYEWVDSNSYWALKKKE
jgi:hypothetical protein